MLCSINSPLPYITSTKATVYMKADPEMEGNIAKCFAKAGRLDIELAKRTKGYFIETHNLLTITTPTGLPEKPAFRNDYSATYPIYHRADWEGRGKNLGQRCYQDRLDGVETKKTSLTSTPSFGFFGFCSEIGDSSQLTDWTTGSERASFRQA